MLLTRDKTFYRAFFALFWPLVLQNVINLGVNLADNIMLGAYNEFALSGATVVNQVQFILQCILGGIGGGLTVIGSQYWGQKRVEPIQKLASISFWICVIFSALLFAVSAIMPEGVVRIFTNSEPVIAEGVIYLRIMKYAYPAFGLAMAFLYALNSVETVKLAFWVSVQTLIVNVGLNMLLIPHYGTAGAAYATLASRVVSLIIVIFYMFKVDKKLNMRIKMLLSFDKTLFKDFVRVATPVVVISGLWGFSNALQTVILGHMNESAIAANSASYALYQLLKSAAMGSSAAAAIVMAKTVGAGDISKVREYTKTMQVMFICIGVITASLLYIVKGPVFSFYKLSDETMRLANQFILVMCVASFGMAYQMPVITGIIRGGGDTRFGMINDIVSIWCIVLPISALAAFKFNWSPVAVVACLNSDQVFKCGAAAIRCNRYKWVKKLTRDESDLKKQ